MFDGLRGSSFFLDVQVPKNMTNALKSLTNIFWIFKLRMSELHPGNYDQKTSFQLFTNKYESYEGSNTNYLGFISAW